VWELVRDRRCDVKFRRQFPIDRYIADFASMEAKLVVEIDGLSHADADAAAYDAERDARLADLGWRVLRVRECSPLFRHSGFTLRVPRNDEDKDRVGVRMRS
jgi:very-short-patch-repair endonuclease